MVRLWRARGDQHGVTLALGRPACGYRRRDTSLDTDWDGMLAWFMPAPLDDRGGTEAETSRAGQERKDATHRGGRPFGCHAPLIGSKRKSPV
jgi:hypothetical protein